MKIKQVNGNPTELHIDGDMGADIYFPQGESDRAEVVAARIVACVNACEGMDDPATLSRQLSDARAEIERLREALRGLLEYPSGQYSEKAGFDAAWEAAESALTAKG